MLLLLLVLLLLLPLLFFTFVSGLAQDCIRTFSYVRFHKDICIWFELGCAVCIVTMPFILPNNELHSYWMVQLDSPAFRWNIRKSVWKIILFSTQFFRKHIYGNVCFVSFMESEFNPNLFNFPVLKWMEKKRCQKKCHKKLRSKKVLKRKMCPWKFNTAKDRWIWRFCQHTKCNRDKFKCRKQFNIRKHLKLSQNYLSL